jgi:hypothetical protein
VARRLSPYGESFTCGFSHVSFVFDEEINRKRGLLIPSILPHSLFSFVSLHEGQRTDEARGEKERSMDASEWAKRNGLGKNRQKRTKEDHWGIKRLV